MMALSFLSLYKRWALAVWSVVTISRVQMAQLTCYPASVALARREEMPTTSEIIGIADVPSGQCCALETACRFDVPLACTGSDERGRPSPQAPRMPIVVQRRSSLDFELATEMPVAGPVRYRSMRTSSSPSYRDYSTTD